MVGPVLGLGSQAVVPCEVRQAVLRARGVVDVEGPLLVGGQAADAADEQQRGDGGGEEMHGERFWGTVREEGEILEFAAVFDLV